MAINSTAQDVSAEYLLFLTFHSSFACRTSSSENVLTFLLELRFPFREQQYWRASSSPTNSIYLSQHFVWYDRPFVVEPEKTKVAIIFAT